MPVLNESACAIVVYGLRGAVAFTAVSGRLRNCYAYLDLPFWAEVCLLFCSRSVVSRDKDSFQLSPYSPGWRNPMPKLVDAEHLQCLFGMTVKVPCTNPFHIQYT